MARSYRGGDRSQLLLLPPDLDDWLPGDHFARFVADVVARLDLSGFERSQRDDGRGRRAYAPAMMLGVVFLAWCSGERSSRRIERLCIESIPFRWITGNEVPDHTTISRFVQGRPEAIEGLFTQVLELVQRAGVLRTDVVFVDGTKIGADASPLASLSRDRLRQEAARIRGAHAARDDADDAALGARRGDELPGELADPAGRGARIEENLRQMQAEDDAAAAAHEQHLAARKGSGGRPPKPPAPTQRQGNVTDPDARTMKTPRGFGPSYNAQAVVTSDQIVVAVDVTQDRSDNHLLAPMTQAAAAALGVVGADRPRRVVADAGYWNDTISDQSGDGCEQLVPAPPNRHRTAIATRGPIPAGASRAQRMQRKLALKANKATYAKRKTTVEPVFGQIKAVLGIRRFRRRGLDAVRNEWCLIATVHNLRKLWMLERLQLA